MDSPNVNWSFYDKLSNERNEIRLPELPVCNSCGLHILHGSFKTGENQTEWKLETQILKSLYKLFDDSPVRRDNFVDLTGITTEF